MPPSRSPSLRSLLLLASLLRQTHSWTLSWTGPDKDVLVEPGKWDGLSHPCKAINNPKDAYFEFDSEGDPVTIFLYPTNDCSGSPSGEASHRLDGNASRAILSYEVVDKSESSSTSSTSTSTTTSTQTETNTPTATPTETTPTSTPSDDSSSGGSISAGAIGGLTAGIVVGAALIGAAILFARRRYKSPNYASPPLGGPTPYNNDPSAGNTGSNGTNNPTTPSPGANMIAAPYMNNNETPYSPADSFAPQVVPYSPLQTSQSPAIPFSPLQPSQPQHDPWPAKSPIYSPDMVSSVPTPPVYVQNQPQQQKYFAELAGDPGMIELSGTQMVNEIDGRSRSVRGSIHKEGRI
ncbi:hypothetical protein BDW62DRAFT_172854 [Aspergillus aurantiobrunneus]